MVIVANRLIGAGAALALAGWSMSAYAEVSASLDRTEVQLNESFGLALEVDSSTNAAPDLSVLRRDFEIVSQSQSNNVSIINGEYAATTKWNLDLMAKRAGQLTIPAIAVGGESSEPLEIKVTQVASGAPQNADLFLEFSLDPEEAYVQQQIVVTLQLFLGVNPIDLRLTPLAVSSSDAVIEQLGGDVEFGTTRGGKRYRVIERSYVIFPQESGTLTVEAATAEARVSNRGFGTFGRSSLMRSHSEPMDIEIKPIPAAFTGTTWLPASRLDIEEGWSSVPPTLRVGEPSTRTLIIEADGLAATQLPELAPYMPGDLKHYADQPELEDTQSRGGVTGSRTERFAIIPTSEGDFALPKVEIPWWNTETDSLEVAVLPARLMQVDGSAQAPHQDLGPKQPSMQTESTAQPNVERAPQPWSWVSLGLALGWLLTVLAWFLNSRTPTKRPAADGAPNPKASRTALAKACSADQPKAAKDALLRWSKAVWPANPTRSLGDLAARAGDPLSVEVRRLSEALYGNSATEWRGQPLWEAFVEFDARSVEPASPATEVLPPLYRA